MNEWKRPEGDGGKFDIDLLHTLELDIIKKTSAKSEAWFKGLWKWLMAVFALRWTARTFDEFMKQSQFSLDAKEVTSYPERAIEIAINQAKKDIWGNETSTEKKRGTPYRSEALDNAIIFAKLSSGLKMREWADGFKNDVRWQAVEALREGITREQLAKRLETRWEKKGQDFTTIAVTEINTAYNVGYLMALPEHSYVTVLPIHDNKVCKQCKKLLEGKVFEVLHHAPENPTKEQLETCVWPGKSNIGRELKNYVPAIPLHVGCRHFFTYVSDAELKKGWVRAHTRGFAIRVKRYWRDDDPHHGKGTWKDFGLPSWSEIIKKARPINVPLWDEKYSDKGLAEFIERAAKLGHLDGNDLCFKTLDDKLVKFDKRFHYHLAFAHKNDDRTRYLTWIVATLLSPMEIWRQPVGKTKTGKPFPRMGRVYISYLTDERKSKARNFFVAVAVRDGQLVGITAAPLRRSTEVDNKRHGALIYEDSKQYLTLNE